MRIFFHKLLIAILLSTLLFSAAATADESLLPNDEESGYTEIDDEEDDDEGFPLNVMEDRYDAGRMAFLFGQYKVAYKAWLPLADSGYAKAQASIGWMFHTGNGVTKDLATAALWYRRAADQGHEIAQNNLGYFYEKGLNGPVDLNKAAIWYKMAADQGYAYAQYNLGMLYAEGRGVKQDIEEAKYWLRIASRQKVKQATAALGVLNVEMPAKKVAPPQPRLAHAPYHSNPVSKGIAWLKKQDPSHYTLQLARSKDMQWILRLAASGDVDQPLIHYQSKDKNGEEWHHLIYGSFPTKAAARAAIKKLPASMRKRPPWIRLFADIHKQLQQ